MNVNIRKNSKRYTVLGLIILFFLIVSVVLKTMIPYGVFPVERWIYASFYTLKDLTVYLKDKEDLYRENKELHRKIQILELQMINLRYMEKENKILRNYLAFKTTYGINHVKVAKVIAYSPDEWLSGFVVDIGMRESVRMGDLVIYNGYVVGMVDKVYDHYSTVIGINDKGYKMAVRTSKTGELCLYQGFENRKGLLKFVRPEQDIRIGDTVVTDTISENIPSGIPVGIIKSISQKEGEFFRTVEVDLFYKQNVIDYVLIVSR